MAETNHAKVKLPHIRQVALVIEDLAETMENYWNLLCIGPWEVYDMHPPALHGVICQGKPVQSTCKVGMASVGETEIELIQPVSRDGVFGSFMAQHGEGLHHIQFMVDNIEPATRMMSEAGFPPVQSGHVADGMYVYYDTLGKLKATWEAWKPPTKMSPDYIYPDKDAKADGSKVKITRITQVALVVKDLKETMANYWNICDIGPWDFLNLRPPTLSNTTYHGKPGQFTMNYALADVGNMQMEPVEPVSGRSIYSDFLEEHGEGLHHLMFTADNLDELARQMNDKFPVLQSGYIEDGVFTYYDTVDALKTVWEIWQPGQIDARMERYPKYKDLLRDQADVSSPHYGDK